MFAGLYLFGWLAGGFGRKKGSFVRHPISFLVRRKLRLLAGLELLATIWAVAHVSGAHFNPAVTLAMLMDGRTSLSDAIGYWIGQFAGATVASLVVLAASSQDAVATTMTTFQDRDVAILLEVILTAIFVWTILAVTKTGGHTPQSRSP